MGQISVEITPHTGSTLNENQQTRIQGFAGLHFEPVIIPKDPNDGSGALTYSVALAYTEKANPMARRYVKERYNVKDLGIPDLTSDYGRMLSSPNDTIINGPANIILAVREPDWTLSIVESLGHEKAKQEQPRPGQDYGRVAFPASGIALWPEISTEAHSRLLRVEALFNIAVQRGEVLRGGKHTPCNSCGAFSASVLATVLPDSVLSMLDAHTTELDQLGLNLMHIAPKHLWAREGKAPRIYDVLPGKRNESYEEVSRDEAERRVERVVRDHEIFKQVIPGFSSWGNHYMTYTWRHPNQKAGYLYEEAFKTMVNELDMRASKEDLDFMLG